jgi:hypothetical protein
MLVRHTGLCPGPGMWLGWGFRLLMLGLDEWSWYLAQLAPLHHMDRSSGRYCQDGGFRRIVVILCKVLENNQ